MKLLILKILNLPNDLVLDLAGGGIGGRLPFGMFGLYIIYIYLKFSNYHFYSLNQGSAAPLPRISLKFNPVLKKNQFLKDFVWEKV